jgi:transcriptional regulator with XRE-family HTH domain
VELQSPRSYVVESVNDVSSIPGASHSDLVPMLAMTGARSLSAAVGRRLQHLRLSAGIPVARLAKNARLSAFELQRIEDGLVQASIGTLSDLAAELGASVAELVRDAKRARVAPKAPAARDAPVTRARSRDVTRMGPEQIARAIVELPDGIDKIEVVEAAAVRYAVQVSGGNKSHASRILGMQRQALGRRLRQLAK